VPSCPSLRQRRLTAPESLQASYTMPAHDFAAAVPEAEMHMDSCAEEPLQQLFEAEPSIREQAAKKLGRLGTAVAPRAASALASCLSDSNSAVRKQAARALGKMGKAAAPHAAKALACCLADANAEVRAATAGAIGWLTDAVGPYVIADLGKCLQDCDARVRIAAAGSFGRLGEAAACDAAEALAACLTDSDLHVQVAAAGSLARHLKAMVVALTQRLRAAESAEVRQRAAGALGCMGEAAAPYSEQALVLSLADPSRCVREAAMKALGQMGKQVPASAAAKVTSGPPSLPRLLGTPTAKTKKNEMPSFFDPPLKGDALEQDSCSLELA